MLVPRRQEPSSITTYYHHNMQLKFLMYLNVSCAQYAFMRSPVTSSPRTSELAVQYLNRTNLVPRISTAENVPEQNAVQHSIQFNAAIYSNTIHCAIFSYVFVQFNQGSSQLHHAPPSPKECVEYPDRTTFSQAPPFDLGAMIPSSSAQGFSGEEKCSGFDKDKGLGEYLSAGFC